MAFPSVDRERGYVIDTALGVDSENGTVIADNIVGTHRHANARLIASAPELLEALEAWITYDTRDDSGPNAGVQMMLDYDTALTLTRAAIARARGAA